MTKPIAWVALNQLSNTYSAFTNADKERLLPHVQQMYGEWIPAYKKSITNDQIESVIIELRKKSFDPNRWVDVYEVAIETIIELRNQLKDLQQENEKLFESMLTMALDEEARKAGVK